MRAATGAALVRMAASAVVHRIVGADALEAPATQAAWHGFADLMREVADSAAGLGEAQRAALARQLDAAIGGLRQRRVRVLAGAGGRVLFVAVLPVGARQDLRGMFAAF